MKIRQDRVRGRVGTTPLFQAITPYSGQNAGPVHGCLFSEMSIIPKRTAPIERSGRKGTFPASFLPKNATGTKRLDLRARRRRPPRRRGAFDESQVARAIARGSRAIPQIGNRPKGSLDVRLGNTQFSCGSPSAARPASWQTSTSRRCGEGIRSRRETISATRSPTFVSTWSISPAICRLIWTKPARISSKLFQNGLQSKRTPHQRTLIKVVVLVAVKVRNAFLASQPRPLLSSHPSRIPHARHWAALGLTRIGCSIRLCAARIWSAIPNIHALSSSVFSTRVFCRSPVTIRS